VANKKFGAWSVPRYPESDIQPLEDEQEFRMLKNLAQKLLSAKTVVLSTHRHCDGDGLGAEMALFHALSRLGKNVRILHLDPPAKKYEFLATQDIIEIFNEASTPLEKIDLALIFDTNDRRLIEPLFSRVQRAASEVIFLDHHPVLKQGPEPTPGSIIDTAAASTGEMTYRLLQEMGAPLTPQIARALYTSVVFDTQLFRYVKSDPRSHLMAADLLLYERSPEEIHRKLFATYTVEKMLFLGRALAHVEYSTDNRIAFVPIATEDFKKSGLERDESGDVIDLVMNVESVEAAALAREDSPGHYKLSFRSKGRVPVLPLAEKFGGGGHTYAAGAHVTQSLEEIRTQVMGEFQLLLKSVGSRS
jgi:phosphoesterase RecJ-like protein